MAGIRVRKRTLILAVKAHVLCGELKQEEADTFEVMYRRCRTQEEQDQVTRAVHTVIDGWKDKGAGGMAGGAYAHLARIRAGVDIYAEDDDPPALKAALERARVDVRRRY
jgi:hypothetical protein